jgi:Ser/Thr protein kinase RdoA (MazF antagonist)
MTVGVVVHAARGLGELASGSRRDQVTGFDWLTMRPPFGLRTHVTSIQTCHLFLESVLSDRLLVTFGRLSRRQEDLAARFTSLPTTLCHGDAHAGNVVVDPAPALRPGRRVKVKKPCLSFAAVSRPVMPEFTPCPDHR